MEKEYLTTELQSTREELARWRKGAANVPQEGDKAVLHIDSYQPNNPLALQRKVRELIFALLPKVSLSLMRFWCLFISRK